MTKKNTSKQNYVKSQSNSKLIKQIKYLLGVKETEKGLIYKDEFDKVINEAIVSFNKTGFRIKFQANPFFIFSPIVIININSLQLSDLVFSYSPASYPLYTISKNEIRDREKDRKIMLGEI